MKIKAIAPWAGSKRNLAREIIREVGPHRAWWDLGCGSCAVTLCKAPASMETICDLNGELVNLALCIQDDDLCSRLEERLHRTWMSDDIFRRSAEIIRNDPFYFSTAPCVERAYHYFVFCWMGRNGDAGATKVGYSFCKRYTKNGGHAATRFKGVVDSLTSFNERMRNLTILRSDLFVELPRIEDAEGVAMYVDPPYIKKGLKYVHDFAQQVSIEEALADGDGEADGKWNDHVRLAKMLARFAKTRVVVSYYDEPELALLYPAWTKRKFEVSKSLANSARRGKSDARATEVLLINGPSLVDRPKERSLFK